MQDQLETLAARCGDAAWPLLAITVLGAAFTVWLSLRAARGERVHAALWLAAPLALLLVGEVGTLLSMGGLVAVLESGSVELGSSIGSWGYAEILHPRLVGRAAASVLLLCASLLAGTSALQRPSLGSRLMPGPALVAFGVCAALGGWVLGQEPAIDGGSERALLAWMILMSGLGLALACLRTGGSQAAHLAEARLAASLCMVGAVATAALALHAFTTRGLNLVGNPLPEDVPALLALWRERQGAIAVTGARAAAGAAFAGVAAAAWERGGVEKSQMKALYLLAAAALALVGLAYAHEVAFQRIAPWMEPLALARLREEIPDLPRLGGAPAGGRGSLVISGWHGALLVRQGGRWIDRAGEDEPLALPLGVHADPLLAVPASTPAAEIAGTMWAPYESPLRLLAVAELSARTGDPYRDYGALRSVPLTWRSSGAWLSSDPPIGRLWLGYREEGEDVYGYLSRDERGLVAVKEEGGGALLLEAGQAPERASTVEEAIGILANRLAERPAIGEVLLVPGAGWTAQTLVALCAAAHIPEERACSITPEVPAGFLARLSPDLPPGRPRFAAEADRDPHLSLGCYPPLREGSARDYGVLPFDLEIDEAGRVVSVERARFSHAHQEGCLVLERVRNPAIAACLGERLRQVRFSPPTGGRASVQHTFEMPREE